MSALLLLSLLLASAGCVALYLASPHQRWRPRPWPRRRAHRVGALLLVGSLIVLSAAMQPVAAVFTVITWAMVMLVLLPLVGVLRVTKPAS
ncbi:hypothetical protein F1188_16660 [Roseospira marina]|uniref:DUF3325 domain-containing protein n=1 Tax=Roseospira marina TaxID=140057 RepID=A0A5M6I7S1_9PROT|nr:hypothetical protein [Roseospira marina]KAA5604324.1 hypothetical protein F1188_16660 [Roseospira marina]MBB4315652.1 cell division protein FtsW (lipid II flippase) [Roseospira marina]MBB5088710.1 cell division protein FtsW (lipid II flippase) [Roseospira marina]